MAVLTKFLKVGGPERNALTLISGNSIAQLIPLATMPFITRLYTPEELGGLGIIMAVAGVLAVIATGRYDMGVLLPRSDRLAAGLVWIAVILSLILGLVVLGFVFALGSRVAYWLDAPSIEGFLYVIPLLVVLIGIYQTLIQWVIRKGQYRRIAMNKIGETGSGSAVSLGLGIAGAGLGGLVSGTIVAQLYGTSGMLRAAWRSRLLSFKLRRREIRYLLIRYSSLPKVSVLSSLVNAVAQHSPIILLGIFFGPLTTGLYALTSRVLNKPAALISNSVSAVFKQEAAKAYNATGSCRRIYLQAVFALVAASLVPFLVLILSAPFLFRWVFGDSWTEAGEYTQILSILVWLKFIGMPLCYMFYLAERLRADLVYQIGFAIITIGSLSAGYWILGEIKSTLLLYVVAYSSLYLVRLWHSYLLTVSPVNRRKKSKKVMSTR